MNDSLGPPGLRPPGYAPGGEPQDLKMNMMNILLLRVLLYGTPSVVAVEDVNFPSCNTPIKVDEVYPKSVGLSKWM